MLIGVAAWGEIDYENLAELIAFERAQRSL
jgi:hypothetical protein